MIPSPKARFLADSESAKRHADIVTSASFQDAIESCLLEYIGKCALTTVPTPDACHWKAQGAVEFATALCSLHNPRSDYSPQDFDNLT